MKIIYKGFEEFSRKVEGMARRMRGEMETTTRKAVLYVHSTVPPYPGEPAGSEYRRTGTLGRSIGTEVRPIGVGFVGIIGTPTVYAPYVISEEAVGSRGPQARFHKGRWWTLQGVVRKAFPKVVGMYEEMWRRVISGL
jgi:hypothetical protein